jgi:hypothetical protein
LHWAWIVRIGHERYARELRSHLLEQLEPFRPDSGFWAGEAGRVTAWMGERPDKALCHRLVNHEEDDWDGLDRPLQRRQRPAAPGHQDVRPETKQFRYCSLRPLGAPNTSAKMNAKVAIDDPSVAFKGLPQNGSI